MRLLSMALAATSLACMTPRSLMLGQTAAGVGRGAAEIGVASGIGYASQVAPPVQGTTANGQSLTTQLASRAFALPAVEGNAQFGLTDQVGFNLHLSPAGLQPGLKLTLNRSKAAQIALMPQVAFGYASYGSDTYVTQSDGTLLPSQPTSTTSLTFMGGLRLIVSHRSGFYASIGYDFVATRSVTTGTIGTGNAVQPSASTSTTLQHSAMANLGWSIAVGWVRVRPEVAFAFQPAISSTFFSAGTQTSAYGGYGFCVIPGFSLVAATPPVPKEEDSESPESTDAREAE